MIAWSLKADAKLLQAGAKLGGAVQNRTGCPTIQINKRYSRLSRFRESPLRTILSRTPARRHDGKMEKEVGSDVTSAYHPLPCLVYDSSKELVMAALDWSQCPAVESIPGKVSGAWVFRGTRMPVATVFENLEAGASIEEIIEWFDLTREQVTAVLDFAARSLETPAHR